jgi:hypothetical protein
MRTALRPLSHLRFRASSDPEGPIVATGRRCPECASPMVRRVAGQRYLWVCTDTRCGEDFPDREPPSSNRCVSKSRSNGHSSAGDA